MRTAARRIGARLGVQIGLLVGRLVATERLEAGLRELRARGLRARSVPPAPVRWTMPAELTAGARTTTGRELLRRLRTDRGCVGAPPRRHLACRAALELARRDQVPPEVLAALEETVTAAARPRCVRSAGVRGLAVAGTDDARRALERVRQVTRRRAEWDQRADDRDLTVEIDAALRSLRD